MSSKAAKRRLRKRQTAQILFARVELLEQQLAATEKRLESPAHDKKPASQCEACDRCGSNAGYELTQGKHIWPEPVLTAEHLYAVCLTCREPAFLQRFEVCAHRSATDGDG